MTMPNVLTTYTSSLLNNKQAHVKNDTKPEQNSNIIVQKSIDCIVQSNQSSTESLTVSINIEDRLAEIVTKTQNKYKNSSFKIEIKDYIYKACKTLIFLLKTSAIITTIYHILYFIVIFSKYMLQGGASSSFISPLIIALGTLACILFLVILKIGITYKQSQLDEQNNLLAHKIIAIEILGDILLKAKDYQNCSIHDDNIEKLVNNFKLIDKLARLVIETNLAKLAKIQENEINEYSEDNIDETNEEESTTIAKIRVKKLFDALSVLSTEFFAELFKVIEFQTDKLEDKIQVASSHYIENITQSNTNLKLINVVKKSIAIAIQKTANKQQES
jgi:hypothetical protein